MCDPSQLWLSFASRTRGTWTSRPKFVVIRPNYFAHGGVPQPLGLRSEQNFKTLVGFLMIAYRFCPTRRSSAWLCGSVTVYLLSATLVDLIRDGLGRSPLFLYIRWTLFVFCLLLDHEWYWCAVLHARILRKKQPNVHFAYDKLEIYILLEI